MKTLFSILIWIAKAYWFFVVLLFTANYTPLRKYAVPEREPIMDWWIIVIAGAPVAVLTGLVFWLMEQAEERAKSERATADPADGNCPDDGSRDE